MLKIKDLKNLLFATRIGTAIFIFISILTSLLIIIEDDLPFKWKIAILIAFFFVTLITVTKKYIEITILLVILNLFFNIDQIIFEFPNMGTTPGIRIALIDFLLLLLLLDYFGQTRNKIKEHFLIIKPIIFAWLLLFMFAIFSMINSGFPLTSIGFIMEMIRCILTFVVVSKYCLCKKNIEFIITVLSAGVIIEAIIIFAQNANSSLIQGLGVLGQSSELVTERWLAGGAIRPGGTFGHPNNVAQFMVVALPIIGSSIIYRFRFFKFLISGVAFSLGFYALLLTYSRMGWGTFFISLISLLVIRNSHKTKNQKVNIATWFMIIFLVIVSIVSFGLIKNRFISKDYGAAVVRFPMMKEAIYMFLENPVFGVSSNNYTKSISYYDIESIFYRERTQPVHNEILLHFAELGIFGGMSFLFLWISAIKAVWNNMKNKDHFVKVIGAGIFSGILAQLIFLQAQWTYLEGYPLFWVVIGVSFGMKGISKKSYNIKCKREYKLFVENN